MQSTVAEVLVQYLKEAGVRHIFGVSGHSIFDITDALYREPAIQFVPAQIELSAAYMADAYARATRSLGVCLASAGAGATNLLTGVAQAFKESSPVMVLCSDVDREYAGKGPSSWHEVPQEELFAPITKMSRTVRSAEDLLEVLVSAHRLSMEGRRGPVYVGIPRDLQTEEIEVPSPPWVPPAPDRPKADAELIHQAAEMLAGAKAPTIILGGGTRWSGAEEAARGVAELLQAPFGTTPSHKGLISEAHPLSLGVLGFGAFSFANRACLESDVVLAVGTTFSEASTLGYGDAVIPRGCRIIHVDIDPAQIGRIYSAEVGIVADARTALEQLAAELRRTDVQRNGPSARLSRIAAEKSGWQEEISSSPQVDRPITQSALYRALMRAIPEDTRVVGEGGTRELLAHFLATAPTHQSGDFRAIGHGLASAIALKYAEPERPVVDVAGDGAFMMELQELATAARDRLPLVVVVVHNDAYGNMKRDQIRHYGGRVIGTDLHVPDLSALAAAFGVSSERVERVSELEGAIRRALAVDGPAVLDVICPIEGI